MDTAENREILAELAREHEELRALLRACERAAEEAERSEGRDDRSLVRAAALLCEALARHNLGEEHRLRPILLAADAFGEVRVTQMMEDHIAEQASILAALRDVTLLEDPHDAARVLRECTGRIAGLLRAEEEQFLNDEVVRDDVVTIDAAGA